MSVPLSRLSEPMRDLLWRVAQHKYGWAYVGRHNGQQQVVEALVRRGLATYADHLIGATDAGRAEIERRWPVSPFALGTYDHHGWTPKEGRVAP